MSLSNNTNTFYYMEESDASEYSSTGAFGYLGHRRFFIFKQKKTSTVHHVICIFSTCMDNKSLMRLNNLDASSKKHPLKHLPAPPLLVTFATNGFLGTWGGYSASE